MSILRDFINKIWPSGKPKIHICQFIPYLTTGHGSINTGTRAVLSRCKCGKEQVTHKAGTFTINH